MTRKLDATFAIEAHERTKWPATMGRKANKCDLPSATHSPRDGMWVVTCFGGNALPWAGLVTLASKYLAFRGNRSAPRWTLAPGARPALCALFAVPHALKRDAAMLLANPTHANRCHHATRSYITVNLHHPSPLPQSKVYLCGNACGCSGNHETVACWLEDSPRSSDHPMPSCPALARRDCLLEGMRGDEPGDHGQCGLHGLLRCCGTVRSECRIRHLRET